MKAFAPSIQNSLGKRYYTTSVNGNGFQVIDLTGESDEEPPSKRQRSESLQRSRENSRIPSGVGDVLGSTRDEQQLRPTRMTQQDRTSTKLSQPQTFPPSALRLEFGTGRNEFRTSPIDIGKEECEVREARTVKLSTKLSSRLIGSDHDIKLNVQKQTLPIPLNQILEQQQKLSEEVEKGVANIKLSTVISSSNNGVRTDSLLTGKPKPNAPSPVINIPSLRTKQQTHEAETRKSVLDKVQKDVLYAENHYKKVEKHLGRTGFSEAFHVDDKKAFNQRVALQKLRHVDRSKIILPVEPPIKILSTLDDAESSKIIHPLEQVQNILKSRFVEFWEPPLIFSKKMKHHRPYSKFQFVSENVMTKGVKPKDMIPPVQASCKCIGVLCGSDCSCLLKELDNAGDSDDDDDDSGPHAESQITRIRTYYQRKDGLIVLANDFIDQWSTRVEIFECNDNCRCSPNCINRVVQRGRTVPLEIFETSNRGFGVRARHNVVRGQFIDLYLGEIISEAELERREDAAEEGAPSYIYSLDWFSNERPTLYHVDGAKFGSAMRFVNHSCKPNAKTFPVMNPHGSKQLHLIGFFAIADIPAGREITIDYDPQFEAENGADLNDESVARCLCGESNCRKRLWRPAKRRRTKRNRKPED